MNDNQFRKQVEEIVSILVQSDNILFITGAGISAESGLPTYRGISGLYNNEDTEDGVSIESALSGHMMLKNPKLTWKYIARMEETCRDKSYNRAHEVIAQLEPYFRRVCIFTQNVDGFHHRAGSTNIIDIHGNLLDLYCLRCSHKERVEDYSRLDIPPSCPRCAGMMRPDVVLFEEMLSTMKLKNLSEEFQKGFDIIFSVGTTSVFPYIYQPVISAYEAGIPTVEINPTLTRISESVHFKISETATKALNTIFMMYLHQKES